MKMSAKIIFLSIVISFIMGITSNQAYADMRKISGSIILSSGTAPYGGITVDIISSNYHSASAHIPEGTNSAEYTFWVSDGMNQVEFNEYTLATYDWNERIPISPSLIIDTSSGDVSDVDLIVDANAAKIFRIYGTVSLESGVAPAGGLPVSIGLSPENKSVVNIGWTEAIIPEGKSLVEFYLRTSLYRATSSCKLDYGLPFPRSLPIEYPALFNPFEGCIRDINIIIPSSGSTNQPSETNSSLRTISGTVTLISGIAPRGGIPVYIDLIAIEDDGEPGMNEVYSTLVTIPEFSKSTTFSVLVDISKSGYVYGFSFADSRRWMDGWTTNCDFFANVQSGDATGINIILEPEIYFPIDGIPDPMPSPALPSPSLPSPTLPSPSLPSPTLPSPSLPSPTLPLPTLPSLPSPETTPSHTPASPPMTTPPNKMERVNLTLSGTISLPDGDKAPPDGILVYVGYRSESMQCYYGPTFLIKSGMSKVGFTIDIDPDCKDDKFYIIALVPNYLNDGSRYKQTPYSDISVYFSSKGSTLDPNLSEPVVLTDGKATGIQLVLSSKQSVYNMQNDVEVPQPKQISNNSPAVSDENNSLENDQAFTDDTAENSDSPTSPQISYQIENELYSTNNSVIDPTIMTEEESVNDSNKQKQEPTEVTSSNILTGEEPPHSQPALVYIILVSVLVIILLLVFRGLLPLLKIFRK